MFLCSTFSSPCPPPFNPSFPTPSPSSPPSPSQVFSLSFCHDFEGGVTFTFAFVHSYSTPNLHPASPSLPPISNAIFGKIRVFTKNPGKLAGGKYGGLRWEFLNEKSKILILAIFLVVVEIEVSYFLLGR